MSSLKRKRSRHITFRDQVDVCVQRPDGSWTLERRPLNTIPFTSIYNALWKHFDKSIYHLTVDRVFTIVEEMKPKSMTEEHLLQTLIEETERREQLLIRRGWVQLGAIKCTNRFNIRLIIDVLKETLEDWEILKELYDFSDDEDTSVAKPAAQKPKYKLFTMLTV